MHIAILAIRNGKILSADLVREKSIIAVKTVLKSRTQKLIIIIIAVHNTI